jgi:hypothetical protein
MRAASSEDEVRTRPGPTYRPTAPHGQGVPRLPTGIGTLAVVRLARSIAVFGGRSLASSTTLSRETNGDP